MKLPEMTLRISVIALMILAAFLVFSLFSVVLSENAEPNMVTVVGLLVTVIICVSLGSWIALEGETTHEIVLLISLFLASGLFLLLSFLFDLALATSSPAWRDYNPTAVYNLSVTTYSLLALAFILGVEAIAVLMSVVRARGK